MGSARKTWIENNEKDDKLAETSTVLTKSEPFCKLETAVKGIISSQRKFNPCIRILRDNLSLVTCLRLKSTFVQNENRVITTILELEGISWLKFLLAMGWEEKLKGILFINWRSCGRSTMPPLQENKYKYVDVSALKNYLFIQT